MSKKSKVIKGLLFVGLATLAGGLTACSKEYEATYTAEYGEAFALPALSQPYTVLDSNGKKVDTANGEFFVSDMDGYTVEVGKSKIQIKVADTTAPKIHVENSIVYAARSEKVDFGDVTAYDAHDGETAISATVTFGETTAACDLADFTPQADGVYTVKLAAKDSFSNASEKTLYVKVTEDGKNDDKIAEFSAVYGESQIELGYGLKAERSTEKKYGTETASLKLTATYEVDGTSWSNYFRLKNLYKEDVRFSHGIYFYVYNESASPKSLKLGDALLYSLTPNEWTEIYVSTKSFESIDYQLQLKKPSMSDLTSFKFEFVTPQSSRTGAGKFYFSDIYEIPYVDTYQFRSRLANLGGTLEQSELGEWKTLDRAYTSYTTAQRQAIDNLGYINAKEFCAYSKETIDDLVTNYGYSEESLKANGLYPREILDTLWLGYHTVDGFERDGNKIVYCDSELATKQLVSWDNTATTSFVAKADLPQTVANGVTEAGVMKVQTGDAWGASLSLDFPIVGNYWTDAYAGAYQGLDFPASVYTTYDLDLDYDSVYSKISFKVYVDPSVVIKRTVMCSFNSQRIEIVPGEWTEITFDVRNKTLKNSTFYFYGANDTSYMTWLSGVTFYMSSVTATPVPTASSVQAEIQSILNDNVALGDPRFATVYDQYRSLSALKRAKVSNAKALVEYIKNTLGLTNVDADTAVDFESELGLYQIDCPDATAEILTGEQYAQYYYGDDTGVLKVTLNESAWELGIAPILPLNVNAPNGYSFYVYLENDYGDKINFASWNSEVDENNLFYLKEGEWTKFTIPASDIGQDYIFAYCNDWLDKLPKGFTLYISSIRAN